MRQQQEMVDAFPFYFDTVSQNDVLAEYRKAVELDGKEGALLVAYSPDWYQHPETGEYRMERYTFESLARIFRAHGAYLYPVKYDDSLTESLKDVRFDGWLIGGGRDIDPAQYKQENAGSHVFQPWADLRWNHMRHFLDNLHKAVPVFGICYGMQVLNCLLGGTMIQHLAEKSHYRKIKMNVEQESWVQKALQSFGGPSEWVMGKCVHHQALDAIAPSLRVVARDEIHSIPHAVEYSGPENREILAVQWHPEYSYTDSRWDTLDPANDALVKYFVQRCRLYNAQATLSQ